MREIVSDKKIRDTVNEYGVSAIELLDAETVKQLRKLFFEIHTSFSNEMLDGYYVSMFANKKEYHSKIHHSFLEILSSALNKFFNNYKTPIVVAQIKGTGSDGTVNIHQDLTVVDESNYRSYVLWIPLEDSTPENGALWFLEKSHKVFRNFRMHTSDYMYREPEDFIIENSTLYSVNAGNALLFDPATLHFSGRNTTNHPRVSIAVEIVDFDASLQILHTNDVSSTNTTAELYSVPENFWLEYDKFTEERNNPPKFGSKVSTVQDVRLKPYNLEEFKSIYKNLN